MLDNHLLLLFMYSKFLLFFYFSLNSRTLDKTISSLEMELAAARAAQESILNGSPLSENMKSLESTGRRKYFMVVGINTAFSSRKRRDSVRATWMPQGSIFNFIWHLLNLFTCVYYFVRRNFSFKQKNLM